MRSATKNDKALAGIIAGQVRAYRKARGITQADLAERIGIRAGPLSGIEKGRHVPSGRVLLALAEALGVGMDDLCGRRVPIPRAPDNELLVLLVSARLTTEKLSAAIRKLENQIKIP